MKKKGLSPVIATVLLISIVIVIGLIVFLWFKGMTEEAITKFDGTNVKLVCEELVVDASYSWGYLHISNHGDIPIYRMKMKTAAQGSYDTTILKGNWPATGLNMGDAVEINVDGMVDGETESILLIPVLVGSTSEGDKSYTCEERNGIEVSIENE